MSKPFNPFRHALYHLRTYEGHDRGVYTLQGSNSMYICCALAKVSNLSNKYSDYTLVNRAIENVSNMLSGFSTAEDWLVAKVPGVAEWFKVTSCGVAAAAMQDYRWRWLNHMADAYDRGKLKLD